MTNAIIIQEDSSAREALPEEVAYIFEWQKEVLAAEKQIIDEQKAKEEAAASANAKLLALGLTEAEIAALKS
jgi:hypothetical protein